MTQAADKRMRRQELAIAGLLTCATVELAAKHAGISLSTMNRLLADDGFQRAFRESKQAALQQAIARLTAISGQAVETLRDVMADPNAPASARVQASRVTLDMAIKSAEVEDLMARVQALEEALNKQSRGIA